MFGAIRETYQLSSAAAFAQGVLENLTATGLFSVDPKALAHRVVAMTFARDKDVFNGKKGPKPHKMSMAALAFAQGMRHYDRHSDEYMASYLALGAILMEFEVRGGNYSLNGKDAAFIEIGAREYAGHEDIDWGAP
jgi:hypothetical protein